jgi:hypothetical protein
VEADDCFDRGERQQPRGTGCSRRWANLDSTAGRSGAERAAN